MTGPHRVLVLAAATGALVGLVVAAFEEVVGRGMLEWVLDQPTAVQVVAPAVGIALAWAVLRYLGRGATPALADEYLDAYHRDDASMPLQPVVGKALAAAATLGSGGAMGFEGPSIYLGSVVGSVVRRCFPRAASGSDQRVLLVAGAAAGVAAIFKAPATGAVFALEVPYQEDTASHAVVPAVVGGRGVVPRVRRLPRSATAVPGARPAAARCQGAPRRARDGSARGDRRPGDGRAAARGEANGHHDPRVDRAWWRAASASQRWRV